MELFEAEAKRESCYLWWTKVQSAAHRGEPDVAMRMTRCETLCPPDLPTPTEFPVLVARTVKYGPDAHIEFKRGNQWPTRLQAVRAAGMAKAGVPCYLLQMHTRNTATVWMYPMEGMLEGLVAGLQIRKCLDMVCAPADWHTIAAALTDLISRR